MRFFSISLILSIPPQAGAERVSAARVGGSIGADIGGGASFDTRLRRYSG